MKDSDDQTLFLWEADNMSPHMQPRGLLAQSPAEFKGSADMVPYYFSKAGIPFATTNKGIRLHLPVIEHADNTCIMICECQTASIHDIRLVGIKLQSIPDRDSQFLRVSHPLIQGISVGALHGAVLETVYVIKDHAGIMRPSLPSSSSSISLTSGGAATSKSISRPKVEPKDHHMQLILSFDESENDSNIIKIHHMLHRHDSSQAHYYSPGTYGTDTAALKEYVMGGYRVRVPCLPSKLMIPKSDFSLQFLMKQCKTEDEIFIFGSARGAYAALYLAEMIERVGLLSGNEEELAPIVWEVYQDWKRNQFPKTKRQERKRQGLLETIKGFRETVCRPAGRVKFFGLFDMIGCTRKRALTQALWHCSIPSTAQYIRHAVSIDEGRAELSPTLIQSMGENQGMSDIQEVWFPGSHGVSEQSNVLIIFSLID